MIRIDEIYDNVFLPAIQDQTATSLHWFDRFGSTAFCDLASHPPIAHGRRVVLWDQEPLYRDSAKDFFDNFVRDYRPPRLPAWQSKITLITSETDSVDVAWVKDTYSIDQIEHYFFHGWAALDWFRGYNHSYLGQPWMQRDFIYDWICPNNIISGRRRHRIDFFRSLVDRHLLDRGLISFPAECPYSGVPATDLFQEIHWRPPDHVRLPMLIDTQRNHADHSHTIGFWPQAMKSFCHVVTETVYTSDRIHLTEKTFKPVVLQQPFLLVAPRHSLRYLRGYGFQTFGSIWNESYDELSDADRISAVAAICEDISKWSVTERRDAQYAVWRVVKHNFDWFYGGFQDLLWQELTGMIDRCL